eukprot:gene13744-19646_t
MPERIKSAHEDSDSASIFGESLWGLVLRRPESNFARARESSPDQVIRSIGVPNTAVEGTSIAIMGSNPPSGASEVLFQEMVRRIEDLSQKLTAKEREAAQLLTQKVFLEKELEASSRELSSSKLETEVARDELQREATRASLQQQRATRYESDVEELQRQLRASKTERSTMDSTLTVVQTQLEAVKKELLAYDREAAARQREVTELNEYYTSMLEAKEASVESLQQLMQSQQRAHSESQELCMDELRALKASMASTATNGADVKQLTRKVLELEGMNRELSAQLAKAEREAGRLAVDRPSDKHCRDQRSGSLWSDTQGSKEASFGEARSSGLQDAMRLLRDVRVDRDVLQQQLESVEASFNEERTKYERLCRKVATKLARREEELAAASKQLTITKEELLMARETLADRDERTCADVDKAQRSHKGQLESLMVEMEDMRRKHVEATLKATRQSELDLREEAMKYQRRIQDLELELEISTKAVSKMARSEDAIPASEHLRVSSLAGQCAEAGAEQRQQQLLGRIDRLQQELESSQKAVQTIEHSLFAVRAHWGGLRKVVAQLSSQVFKEQQQQRVGHAAGAGMEGVEAARQLSNQEELMQQLIVEWEPTSQAKLEPAVEESMGAAASILETAARSSRETAKKAAASAQADLSQALLQLSSEKVANQRKTDLLFTAHLKTPTPSRPPHLSKHKPQHLVSTLSPQPSIARSSRETAKKAAASAQADLSQALLQLSSEKVANQRKTDLLFTAHLNTPTPSRPPHLSKHKPQHLVSTLSPQPSIARSSRETAKKAAASAQADLSQALLQLSSEKAANQRQTELLFTAQATVVSLKDKAMIFDRETAALQKTMSALKGGQADVSSSLGEKDEELKRRQRTIEDLQANVDLLHQRIEHQQETLKQVDSLKGRLGTIMAEVQVSPIISLPHTLTALANSSRAGALPINSSTAMVEAT